MEEGAREIINNDIIGQLTSMGWDVEFGRIREYNSLKPLHDPPVGILKNPRCNMHYLLCVLLISIGVGAVCKEVAEQVEQVQREGKFALTLGGDHSLGLGTIAGTCRATNGEFAVIWVDAHADINTVETTPSGNIHGMPVAFLLGLCGHSHVEGYEWMPEKPLLRADRIAYIGLRDVDAGEKKTLKQLGIKAFSMHEVDKHGIGYVVQNAIQHVNPHGNLPIHLSFDVDALDPSVAPATGTPVRGGMTFREGHYICEAVCETGKLCAMDLMEVNPTLGDAAQRLQTVQIACSLIRCAMGETLL